MLPSTVGIEGFYEHERMGEQRFCYEGNDACKSFDDLKSARLNRVFPILWDGRGPRGH